MLSEAAQGYKKQNKGLKLDVAIQREGLSAIVLCMKITNFTNNVIENFDLQLNRNYFGLTTNTLPLKNIAVYPSGSNLVKLPITANLSPDITKIPSNNPPLLIEAAIVCNLDEFYFSIPILFCVLFEPVTTHLSKDEYLSTWKKIATTSDMCASLNNLNPLFQNIPAILRRFESNNIYLIHKIDNEDQGISNIIVNFNLTC